MNLVALLASVPPFVVGGLLVKRALEVRGAVGRVARRKTRPIGDLEPGPVEISGRLHAEGPPLEGLCGHPCVALRHVVHPTVVEKRKTTLLAPVVATRVTAARIEDETGEAEVNLEGAEILGERWVTGEIPLAEFSRWGIEPEAGLPPETTHVHVEEYAVRVGARALVSGEATMLGRSAGSGYRAAAQGRYRLEAEPDGALLVHAGPEARFFARALLPTLATLACALALFFTGALALALALL